MSVHNLRSKEKLDYVSLHNGLVDAEGETAATGSTDLPSTLPTTPPPVSALFVESGLEDTSEAEFLAEFQRLTARKQLLEDREKIDARREQLDALRKSVDELESRSRSRSASRARVPQAAAITVVNSGVVKPGVVNTVFPGAKQSSLPFQQSDINLNELRDLSALGAQVDAELVRAGVKDFVEPFPSQHQTFQQGKSLVKQSCVSGKEARVRDSVIKPVTWPHTVLKYSYLSNDITYNKLDFPLLVAGELRILQDRSLTETERFGRMHLLESVAYHTKDYTWGATKSFHETVLVEVERGVRSWDSEDYRDVETGTLFRHPIVIAAAPTTTSRNDYPRQDYSFKRPATRRFFCMNFNKGDCHHLGAHEGTIGRATQSLEHFCSACYRTEHIIRLHPEIKCTYKNKQ